MAKVELRSFGCGMGHPRRFLQRQRCLILAARPIASLLTLEGRRAEEIAAVLGVHISTVRNWRGYFAHGGVAGLRRRTRPGQQAKIGPHAAAIAATILTEDARHDG